MKDFRSLNAVIKENKSPFSYTLNDEERDLINDLCLNINNKIFDIESIIKDLNRNTINNILPQRLIEGLSRFSKSSNAAGAYLIENLPIDEDIGKTGILEDKKSYTSEILLIIISSLFGNPYGYESQRNGSLIQNLFPKEKDKNKQLGTGSVLLDWHTEDAFHEFRCHHIFLYCIRGDKDAYTYVSKINPTNLNLRSLRNLMSKDFEISSDDAHSFTKNEKTCIISINNYSFDIRFDPLFTTFFSNDANDAFNKLKEEVLNRAFEISLRPGDLLIIDNKTAVHGRSSFQPKFDGNDRWLQRVVTRGGQVNKEFLVKNRFNVIKNNYEQ